MANSDDLGAACRAGNLWVFCLGWVGVICLPRTHDAIDACMLFPHPHPEGYLPIALSPHGVCKAPLYCARPCNKSSNVIIIVSHSDSI